MSSASTVVVLRVSVICQGDDLATRQTTPVPAPTRSAMTGSVSARPPAFRVAPKATSRAPANSSSPAAARWKNSRSFGLAPASPLYVMDTEAVQLFGDPQLVGHGEREAFRLAAVS